MYQQILEALKAKFPGVSEKILERKATQLAKTTTTAEQVKTAVDGVTIQQIIDSEGDRRANDAQKTAVKTYEDKHHIKDGKPVQVEKVEEDDNGNSGTGNGTPKGQQASGTEEMPAWAKAMMQQNKQLVDELTAIKGERTAKTRKGKYEALFQKLTDETQKERYMRDFDRLSFKDDEDFDTWLAERTPVIEQEVNSFIQNGAVTTTPKGGASTPPAGEASQDVKDYVEAAASRAAEQSFSSIAGLPTTGAGLNV